MKTCKSLEKRNINFCTTYNYIQLQDPTASKFKNFPILFLHMKLMELETPPPRVKEGKFEDSGLLG